MRRRLVLLFLLVPLALAGAACAYTPRDVDVAPSAPAQSSKVFAADGTLITTLHAEENREDVPLDQIPLHLRNAVLAIEDARFWDHRGVDLRAVLRAARANTREGDVVEGGSTITQQYVKNSFLDPARTFDRKMEEAVLAVQLERRYTKERILELYLNTIYFGNGAYGVEAAAEEYFGVEVGELDLPQSATLAALIRAPSLTDPYDRPEEARARRDIVLDRMVELGWATEAAAAEARAQDLVLTVKPPEERYPAPWAVERAKRFVLGDERFGATRGERLALLFGGGLRIYTTIDLDTQGAAERAVQQVLPDPSRRPDAAVVTLEPQTGYVRALVGGHDFFGGGAQAKIDLATGGGGRPAGSAFKPLVLAAALEEGIPLEKVYPSPSHIEIPLPDEPPWRVENYEGSGGGENTLFESTVKSYNTVYAQLIQEVGPPDAVAMATRLGVQSRLAPYPSAVLGTNNVRPLDMATAYATFANRGLRVDPVFVTKVVRSDGTVLFQHEHAQRRVLDEHIADQVTSVLREAVDRGTGTRARIGRPVAGKTGTGQEWRDAWFVGYTPDLVTAVWLGFSEEGRRSMAPPHTPIRVTGGSWPAQIWGAHMASALADVPPSELAPPAPPPADGGDDETQPLVPYVVGLPAGPAADALTRAGFVVARVEAPSDDRPLGYVVSTSPPGRSRAPAGATVTLVVANGQRESVDVPDVLGMTETDAVSRLRQAGFEPTAIHDAEPSSPGPEQRGGVVWKQNPAAGVQRATGSPVTIWVNPPP